MLPGLRRATPRYFIPDCNKLSVRVLSDLVGIVFGMHVPETQDGEAQHLEDPCMWREDRNYTILPGNAGLCYCPQSLLYPEQIGTFVLAIYGFMMRISASFYCHFYLQISPKP
jgi:hypothetical protein